MIDLLHDMNHAKAAAIIPAFNESATIADVTAQAKRARLIDEVIVVDNASIDNTAESAAQAGARVISCPTKGKGEAMRAGVEATDADVIVFLDGDLVGLTPDHVDALAEPILEGRAGMACGLFDRGPSKNPIFLSNLPILTGERSMKRELFMSLDLDQIEGYKVEAALNARCADLGLPVETFICDGMWHRTKEQKSGTPVRGFFGKVAMLAVAAWETVFHWTRRRLRAIFRRARTSTGSDGREKRREP
jgi:glycosyltransferase involved in cell wall biosynthesis